MTFPGGSVMPGSRYVW